MQAITIRGGHALAGDITVHGAKNSALPLLAATVLAHGTSEIHNCPHLSDVEASIAILRHLGCRVDREADVVTVDASAPAVCEIPDRLMREMRSSIVFLGAIIARLGEATMSHPGGCELGPRPIDLHLSALRRLGVTVEERGGRIYCRAQNGLHGADITLAFPSVGATENVLLAACTAQGETVLRHAAREPEIQDLCDYLNACGARIHSEADGVLVIDGVPRLHGSRHRVIPDRIEAATYLAATAVTGGRLRLHDCCALHTRPIFPALEEAGCIIRTYDADADNQIVEIIAPPRLDRLGTIRTMPYPGFPTDAAAPLLAAACVARGTSVFVESIFENRYKYVDELARLGAHIQVDGRVAVVEGVPHLQGASVACTDLRGGAALVVAALAADGKTVITELNHLDRGYENLTACLRSVGADITRQ